MKCVDSLVSRDRRIELHDDFLLFESFNDEAAYRENLTAEENLFLDVLACEWPFEDWLLDV